MADVMAEVVKCRSNQLVVKITTRVRSAVHMLELTQKFRTEQETEGPWQEFHKKLNYENHYHADVTYEYFKGVSDVILELTVFIDRHEDYKEHEVNSEQIAGTVLQEVKEYLNLCYVSLAKAFESKVIKDLLVFRGY